MEGYLLEGIVMVVFEVGESVTHSLSLHSFSEFNFLCHLILNQQHLGKLCY